MIKLTKVLCFIIDVRESVKIRFILEQKTHGCHVYSVFTGILIEQLIGITEGRDSVFIDFKGEDAFGSRDSGVIRL